MPNPKSKDTLYFEPSVSNGIALATKELKAAASKNKQEWAPSPKAAVQECTGSFFSAAIAGEANNKKYNLLKGFLGQIKGTNLNSKSILHYNTKKVVYSFKNLNNLYPLLNKTEYLFKIY